MGAYSPFRVVGVIAGTLIVAELAITPSVGHFKRFNDDFGHDVGDSVLKEVGNLLRRSTPTEDIACRYGGEEFVVIMPEAPLEMAAARAEPVRERVEQLTLAPRGQTLRRVTISVGAASYPVHGAGVQGVLRAADATLYESKAGGRNRVTLARAGAKPQREGRVYLFEPNVESTPRPRSEPAG